MMADKIVLFMVAGMLMVRQACQFIGDHQGNTPGKPVPVAIILLATAAFALALWVPGMSAQPVVLAAFLLWGILFTVIDISNFWLPWRFTLSFTVTGALILFLIKGSAAVITGIITWGILFLLFRGVEKISLRICGTSVGQGDVYFISALSFWMHWQVICLVSGVGFLLLFCHALIINKKTLPYAPYFYVAFLLCQVTDVAGLI
ncbi:prepilin type IV endopeptidase [Tatumella ptyseos ATCC 33301]|uniref:Prepilin type IV endopeptidase n=2 Tax=Tatumella ptyseos TaxID=82987 RepID=A0A085JDC5_9GAMM|nr:prepilin peptidase [Tatumella ptyseos]KFD18471.1 prepilin type IV endopeptidase [Tatumella ptyseos ATCC 33301]SQK74284.1 Type IV leader peptidase family [Tatumella ptyseos]